METCPRVTRIIAAVSPVQRHLPWSHDLAGAPGHKDPMAAERAICTTKSVGSLMWSGGLWSSKPRRSSFPPTYDLAQSDVSWIRYLPVLSAVEAGKIDGPSMSLPDGNEDTSPKIPRSLQYR